jgi:hypothetical protein
MVNVCNYLKLETQSSRCVAHTTLQNNINGMCDDSVLEMGSKFTVEIHSIISF